MRITANKNPTWDYTIGSNVLGVKDAQHEFCTLIVAKKKPRKFVIYENQGGDALHQTNQMMRIAGHSTPTRDYTIWSNVLGGKEA